MATSSTIDRLIINSPYEEPALYWRYIRESRSFVLESGRRPAGYLKATPGSSSFDDPGVFVELTLVNQIRPRVKAWRENGYSGITGITKKLLEHWKDLRPVPHLNQGIWEHQSGSIPQLF